MQLLLEARPKLACSGRVCCAPDSGCHRYVSVSQHLQRCAVQRATLSRSSMKGYERWVYARIKSYHATRTTYLATPWHFSTALESVANGTSQMAVFFAGRSLMPAQCSISHRGQLLRVLSCQSAPGSLMQLLF